MIGAGAACDGDPARSETPTPRSVDTASLAEDRVVDLVLDECHRPLRGLVQGVHATVTLPDGRVAQVFADLPDRVRVEDADGRFAMADDRVWALDGAEAAAAVRDHVQRLALLVDAVAFGPLHRAQACRRLGPAEFRVAQPDGTPWRLSLRPGTLLPASLARSDDPGDEVRFVDYVWTKSTWVVQVADLDGLGRCRVVLQDDARRSWPDQFFRPMNEGTEPRNLQRMTAPGAEPRSSTPAISDNRALSIVVLEDPGDWPARCAAYRPVYEELERQDQHIAGFPMLWTEHGKAWLGVPFRPRPDGDAAVLPPAWRVRDVAAGRWLYVHPDGGDFATRAAVGRAALETALGARRLTARGPMLAQPFLHLHEGEPTAERLMAPVVRVAVPIE